MIRLNPILFDPLDARCNTSLKLFLDDRKDIRSKPTNSDIFLITKFSLDDTKVIGQKIGIDWRESKFNINQFLIGINV
jgi:hypothetical protein